MYAPKRDGRIVNHPFIISIQLRKSYLKQQIEIQKMRERIKQLESMTSLLSRKDKQEFEREYNRQHCQQQNANVSFSFSLS